jgi:hypothetical protein
MHALESKIQPNRFCNYWFTSYIRDNELIKIGVTLNNKFEVKLLLWPSNL